MSWQYYRDRPVFVTMIALENPVGMCYLGAGPRDIIGWLVWSCICDMCLANLNSELSR